MFKILTLYMNRDVFHVLFTFASIGIKLGTLIKENAWNKKKGKKTIINTHTIKQNYFILTNNIIQKLKLMRNSYSSSYTGSRARFDGVRGSCLVKEFLFYIQSFRY